MKKLRFLSLAIVGFLGFFLPAYSYAQESLSLSVTPPLFQLNTAPGDVWKSSIKVINTNAYELTVYAEVYHLEPQGEDGQGTFLHREGGFSPEGPLLANWMDVSALPIVIPPEQSADVPVTIMLPKNAAPGGHFAAVLIGTRPPEGVTGSVVKTAQIVTSLFFLRVAGDVQEKGTIREFSVAHLFREKPEAEFSLRFENSGNVHLQPQGGITVYNMWGKERGFIPINQRSHFGNVLPGSIRKFDFSWRGEASISDIGRYAAEATLTFGEEGRQNTTSRVYFWVIPLKAGLITIGSFALFIFFVVWMIRRYINRAMYLAGYDAEMRQEKRVEKSAPLAATAQASEKKLPKNIDKKLLLPLKEGVLDLRRKKYNRDSDQSRIALYVQYVLQYRYFFMSVALLAIFVILGFFYFSDVLEGDKKYEITVDRGDTDITLSSDQISDEREGR